MKKFILLVIIIVVIAAVGYAVFRSKPSGSSGQTPPTSTVSADGREAYSNQPYHFSLKHANGLKVSEFANPDGVGDVIVFAGATEKQGFQILVTPYDEPVTTFTADRIRNEVPDLTVTDPQDLLLGDVGKGVAFKDGNGSDANRQIWFVAGGNLYQITAPMSYDDELKNVMNSWEFAFPKT